MPPGNILRQRQKNQVLELLQEAGLNPGEFEWEERNYNTGPHQGPADLLRHNDTDYVFEFHLRQGDKHYAVMSPGSSSMGATGFPGSWEGQLEYVRRWARNVQEDLAAPDLWSLAAAFDELAAVI